VKQLPLDPFSPDQYVRCIEETAQWLRQRLPAGFTPKAVATLGSGGLGDLVSLIEAPVTIPYSEIPYFSQTSVVGHEGKLAVGIVEGYPVLFYCGRRHLYEFGDLPSCFGALKEIVFPIYVAKALGAEMYIGTNAAGGLRAGFKPGDVMVLRSHIDLFYPNVLLGPPVPFADAPRFQPQHMQYNQTLRSLLLETASELGMTEYIHEGVYAAVTGPTYETAADSVLLRNVGADAVGMSTVPEIITATNLGMDTVGLSLIANVVDSDGTNATSHEEVTAALNDPELKQRLMQLIRQFMGKLTKIEEG
jgi:purine-nucleoside phosphorylase